MWIRHYRINFFVFFVLTILADCKYSDLDWKLRGLVLLFHLEVLYVSLISGWWVLELFPPLLTVWQWWLSQIQLFQQFSNLVLGLPIKELLCRPAGISETICQLGINSTINHLMINSLVKGLPLNGLLQDHMIAENLSFLFLVQRTKMKIWMSQIIANFCVPSPTSKPHQGNWEYFLFVLSTATLTSFTRSCVSLSRSKEFSFLADRDVEKIKHHYPLLYFQ